MNLSKPHGHNIYIGRLSTPHRFVNRQGWEKTATVPVERYLVAYSWQGNNQAKHIVRPAMLKLYPWLEEFYFHVYQLCFFKDKQEEFYVTLSEEYGGHKSLYVPFHDFMVGDTEAICKRNESCLSWYRRDWVVWKKMRKDPVVLHFLKSTDGNKKMMYGTCHFVDTEAAVSYYSRYGFDRDEVCGKIKQSEIVIGKPKLEFGEPEITGAAKRLPVD